MQFQKKTRAGNFGMVGKLFIKILLSILILYGLVVLIDRIDFPSPNNTIEKKVPNENFKVIK